MFAKLSHIIDEVVLKFHVLGRVLSHFGTQTENIGANPILLPPIQGWTWQEWGWPPPGPRALFHNMYLL